MSDVAVFEPEHKAPVDLWQSLGIPSRGPGLYRALEDGLPYRVYSDLARAIGLDKQSLAKAVDIAPATMQRRMKSGRFTQGESDRIYRLAQVFSAACELFEGDTQGAQRWINQPVKGLGGVKPIEMMATSAETAAVLDLIGRLEHGVFA